MGSDQLFEFALAPSGVSMLSSGVHGAFSEEDDTLAFRFLYRAPSTSSTQLEEIKLLDLDEEVGTIQLRTGARPLWHKGEDPSVGTRLAVSRQINAAAIDYPAMNDTGYLLRMRLEQTSSLAGTNQYFEPAGAIYYHLNSQGQRQSGMYYSNIADGTWSYSGFGSDQKGSGTQDKKISVEQFTHWLDVTTLDRDQPTLFFWYFAPEAISYDDAFEFMTNMIDQAELSANQVGLTEVKHFIVISHMFEMYGFDEDQVQQFIINQQDAAYALASTRSNVAAASIFAATDGLMFDGRAEATQWLIDRGFNYFEFGSNAVNLPNVTGGDLLDIQNIHPANPLASVFFAAVLGDIIRETGCPADLAVDGVIDINDLLLLLGEWGSDNGDITGDGLTNISDLLLLIGSWGNCWPVQAPFDSVTSQ